MTKVLLLIAVVLWAFLLRGFVSTRTLIVLSIAGPLLFVGGVILVRVMGRHLLQPGWYIGGFIVGLAMIAGALATLSRAAPGDWLVLSSLGWESLEERVFNLGAAVDADDAGLVRRLAGRGLGDTEPLGAGGGPLLHRAKTPEVLAALLESGLDPDTRDAEGRTLLMQTREPEIARLILAAGADVEARDRDGLTVADHLPEEGPLRSLVEGHAGRPLRRTDRDAVPSGRTDWLTVTRDPATTLEPSAVSARPLPVNRGDVVTLTASLANPTAEDRWLDVTATLNDAALFVSASHDGAIESPERPLQMQTVRWPTLSLPAHSQGSLELVVITRSEPDAGNLDVQWRLRRLPSREDETLTLTERLETRAAEPGESDNAWVYVTWAALAVGLWLFISQWRRRTHAAGQDATTSTVSALAAGFAILFGLAAAAFLWSSVEPFVRFEPAECTILDRRARTRTYTLSSSSSRYSSSSASTTRYDSVAVAAVRIEGEPSPVIAAGFADDGFRPAQELRAFVLGDRVPCWVSPSNATRFTLVRRPSLSRIAAIVGLALSTLLLMTIARAMRPNQSDRPDESRRRRRSRGR